jgi:hypothetical protein
MEPADHGEAVLNTVNLDALPVEALQALMASLSFQDAKRLCSSTKELAQRCKRNNLLELKAREYVDQNAPGTAPVTSYRKYADLLWRGFATTYHVDPSSDAEKFAKFGFGGVEMANFNLPGLPREDRTDGWVFGTYRRDVLYGIFVEDCVFFETREQLEFAVVYPEHYPMTSYAEWVIEDSDPGRDQVELLKEALHDLIRDNNDDDYFAIQVFF